VRGLRLGLLGVVLACGLARAQEITLDGPRPVAKQHIVLLSDAVQVDADKPQVVELRFRVDPGFHINSHTPHDETLIPTVLKLDAVAGLAAGEAGYPAGVPFHLSVGAGQTLDVYQGEFRVVAGGWAAVSGLR
jgi:hypothetical protein